MDKYLSRTQYVLSIASCSGDTAVPHEECILDDEAETKDKEHTKIKDRMKSQLLMMLERYDKRVLGDGRWDRI